MTFRPYTKEDKLEVGTKIRLGGREGEIIKLDPWGKTHTVKWPAPDTGSEQELFLAMFAFEIEDIPLPPLTIDKRVKETIKEHLFWSLSVDDFKKRIEAYLNSLEEV